MRPLTNALLRGRPYPRDWQVVAYAVDLNWRGEPRLGRRLFVCRERLFEHIKGLQGLLTGEQPKAASS